MDIFAYFEKFLELNHFKKSRKLSWKISENFQKYSWKLRNITEILKIILKNFKKFWKISIIMAKNFENGFITF